VNLIQRIATIFFTGVLTAGVIASNCLPPPEGLISWWPADGDATDLVGANDGTLVGGAGFAAGHVDDAFLFDGVDDLVSVPDSPTLAFGTSDSPSPSGSNSMISTTPATAGCRRIRFRAIWEPTRVGCSTSATCAAVDRSASGRVASDSRREIG
jgi:hypothetical protein